ncbi:MAG: acetyl-CoA acetyltransferase [Dehalococcoidia bacterium]|jgi:acetyl-CoA C-acetyltransferase|nr:acetyl-CoA acetyltransferase [Dehalococcoidia bacterium]
MDGIKDKVAIIGMGCSKFGENWEKSADDMIIDAAYEAYADAGIESKDIGAAWLGTYVTEQTGQMLSRALKLDYIPVTRVENACATGSDALRNACYAVASGACDIALAVGVEKLKDSGYTGLPDFELLRRQSNTYRTRTYSPPGHFAMMATKYFDRYGLSPEEGKRVIGQIAVKNHHNGALSPKAHFQSETTLEKVLAAPMVAWPLGLFDCCGVSDGAAAAIVTRADLAKKFRPDPIYIKSLQIAVGPYEGYMSPKFDWSHVEETVRAGERAYAEAGVKNPRKEISMAEVHDCFTITELVIMEDLKFSERGKAPDDVRSGFFNLDGGLPINTDGGLKCFGHPIGASGLRMMYEVYKQLQQKADKRQIKNPRLGLTHNLGGTPATCSVSVIIAGNEKG